MPSQYDLPLLPFCFAARRCSQQAVEDVVDHVTSSQSEFASSHTLVGIIVGRNRFVRVEHKVLLKNNFALHSQALLVQFFPVHRLPFVGVIHSASARSVPKQHCGAVQRERRRTTRQRRSTKNRAHLRSLPKHAYLCCGTPRYFRGPTDHINKRAEAYRWYLGAIQGSLIRATASLRPSLTAGAR